jgi:hypothetical protein
LIRTAYRWFLTSPGTLVLVARPGERRVSFTALSDRPCDMSMLLSCKWQVTRGLLRQLGSASLSELSSMTAD